MERNEEAVQKETVSASAYKALYDHVATIPSAFLQMTVYLQENKCLYWHGIGWQLST